MSGRVSSALRGEITGVVRLYGLVVWMAAQGSLRSTCCKNRLPRRSFTARQHAVGEVHPVDPFSCREVFGALLDQLDQARAIRWVDGTVVDGD
jgi:hypothetical protein